MHDVGPHCWKFEIVGRSSPTQDISPPCQDKLSDGTRIAQWEFELHLELKATVPSERKEVTDPAAETPSFPSLDWLLFHSNSSRLSFITPEIVIHSTGQDLVDLATRSPGRMSEHAFCLSPNVE